jgi:hypothetical protein
MTSTDSNNQGLLTSWKEIAAYLDCDERTSRRWEQNFGLPIHRMEGSPKSRVYAYKDELDTWRKEKLNGVLKTNGKELSALKRRGSKTAKMLLWLMPLVVVIIFPAIFLFRSSPGQPQPADFRIEGSKLIVLNGNSKELWIFDAGIPNLEPEKEYRHRFQTKVYEQEVHRYLPPWLVMTDINQDGNVEVLFSTQAEHDDRAAEGHLYCFSSRGEVLWHKRVGREVEFGGRVYSSDFRIHGFVPLDIDADGNLEIILLAYHNPHSPTQLLIFDSGGNQTGEFTNYGRMYDFVNLDLDDDVRKELLFIGQNDEYGKGCLVVFDPSRVSGCSPQFAQNPGPGLEQGSELYYLLFPPTDVDKILNPLEEGMISIDFLQNGRIQLITAAAGLYFELGLDLRLQDVKGSDYFRLQHRELKAAGKISSTLDDAYYDELKKAVLYWDGEQWTSTPTMIRKWNNPR